MTSASGSPRSLPRAFTWLWRAYAVSTLGTWFAFDALAIIAVRVLHAGPAAVSALAAAGPAAGAVLAVPLGPWVESRAKRGVMVAMDLTRAAALLSIPVAYVLGALTVAQLAVVSVAVGAADIAFQAATGARIKALVARDGLLRANGRLESTMWTATVVGPPLGGAAIAALGAVTTVIADAISYLLSALALRAGGPDPAPAAPAPAAPTPAAPTPAAPAPAAPAPAAPAPGAGRVNRGELLAGWRFILASRELRPLFLNSVLVNALIMAPAPLLAVLMLGRLRFVPWQYGLAFGVPCVGALIGSRLSPRLAARFGRPQVLRWAGTARALWPLWLAFIPSGAAGIALVLAVQLGLLTCIGVFGPVLATTRLEATPPDRVARTLAAWSVTSTATTAALTAAWGGLAALAGTRTAIGAAGVLMLATPLLLLAPARLRPGTSLRSAAWSSDLTR